MGCSVERWKTIIQSPMDFKNFLHESGCKPEKIWVDQVLTATELEPTTT